MHITDGILPVGISIVANVAAVALVYAGGRRLEPEEIPKMGVFTAALFIVSLIHFPIPGGASIHLGLYGLAGLLFGFRAVPIIFVNVLFQSLIFQHGGLLSIGVNTLTMSSGALSAAALGRQHNRPKNQGKGSGLRVFACGFLGIFVPAVLLALVFVAAHYGKGMALIAPIYLPAALVEGTLTLVITGYLKKIKPELLA